MSRPGPIEHAAAPPEVQALYDEIKAKRQLEDVNNFWKYLGNDPKTARRTWESLKEIMGPGVLDPVVKELIYVAVSITNGCGYCIASHSEAARQKGMTPEMWNELVAIVGMANETNRLVNAYRVPIDPQFE